MQLAGTAAAGASAGAGGDAESDEVAVIVTERAGNIAQRGTLNAGTITGTAIPSAAAAQPTD